ncbi:E3 ubiquitin-protein ligase RNF26 [Amia ocellicauda]|uniref:E3 ubiquitin-protein ligase RNF26 n=1 Tax=Amia ocellicauda TaxID=2972642 RepID=UPI003463D36C
MGLVYFLFCCIGRTIDFLCFLLDLNFCVVNSLIRLLLGLASFIYHLPMLLTNSVVQCWNLALFCMLTTVEGLVGAAQGSLNVLSGWLRVFCGMSESFKMVGHLSSHVLLRTKELLHRGLLSGHSLLRQVCEGCGIALSLVLYFVNTMVNMLLIGTQNCFSVAAATWDSVSGPLQKAVEFALTLFSYLSSSLVGTAIILWTPCQLALEFLCSLSHIFISVFLLNLYGLVLTLGIVSATTLYLNPGLPRRGADRTLRYISTVPSLSRLHRVLYRLYLVALAQAQAVLELEIWQRVVWQGSQTGQGGGQGAAAAAAAAFEGNVDVGAQEARHPAGFAEEYLVGEMATLIQPPHGAPENGEPAPPLGAQLGDNIPAAPALPSSSTDRPLQRHPSGDGYKEPLPDSLLTLLKEHEERKKCVICQDSIKTVLLLPCRHLCLCRECTNILLRQPIYQHNCPLCRQMILQTMDVYL